MTEHIEKGEDNVMQLSSSQRLRVFSGKIWNPSLEADYDTSSSTVDFITILLFLTVGVFSILESLLPPAADMVKHLSWDTLPSVYLQQLWDSGGWK